MEVARDTTSSECCSVSTGATVFLYSNSSHVTNISQVQLILTFILVGKGEISFPREFGIIRTLHTSLLLPILRCITADDYNIYYCILYDSVGWPSLSERHQKHWYPFIYISYRIYLTPSTLILSLLNKLL